MKKISLTAFAIVALLAAKAQQPGKAVINCMGGVLSANGFQLKCSVGEAAVASFDKNSLTVYQGFFSGGRNIVMTAIPDEPVTHLKVYPNPASGWLHFNAGENEVAKVEVTNSLGQLITSQNNGSSIDVANWENGFYLVKLTDNNQKTFTSKIIKQ